MKCIALLNLVHTNKARQMIMKTIRDTRKQFIASVEWLGMLGLHSLVITRKYSFSL